jgi:hypothetical protein
LTTPQTPKRWCSLYLLNLRCRLHEGACICKIEYQNEKGDLLGKEADNVNCKIRNLPYPEMDKRL